MPGPRESLATDAARDIEGRTRDGNEGRPLAADGPAFPAEGAPGPEAAGVETPLRFRLIIFVNSALNFSLSLSADGCGAVNVKLWPASSVTRATFSLTCAEPSLLQNKAGKQPMDSAE